MKINFLSLTLVAAVWFGQTEAQAYLLGPYTPDAYTLHLWHLDESAAPAQDAGGNPIALTSLAGGATLGNASYAGFGTALSTFDGGQNGTAATGRDAVLSAKQLANSTSDDVAITLAGPSGAFTMEAIVRVDFDPVANLGTVANGGNGRGDRLQIISGENDGTTGRIFQWCLDPVGVSGFGNTVRMRFINLNNAVAVQEMFVDVPSDGPNAIVSNQWYHVAVTYDGNENTPDNIKFYWSRLDQNPSPVEANLIGSSSMQYDLPGGSCDFCIGNEGRASGGASGNFIGLVDEVRISSIARPANAMQFIDPHPAVVIQPVGDTLAVGQAINLGVNAAGEPPLSYQWRLGGAPIAGATRDAYAVAAAGLNNGGDYDVVVTNLHGSVTSLVAAVTVHTPMALTWVGYMEWNTNNMNWDSNGDWNADAAYREGDHVLFDGHGDSQVNLPEPVHPSSVTVNSATDYTFTSANGAGITRNTGLLKRGAGTLVMDLLNTYTGPTVIQGGVMQCGTGGASGSLGSGPVTNNGALILNRNVRTEIPFIIGSGALTNLAGTARFEGTNTLTGPFEIASGSVTVRGAAAQGQHSRIILKATGSPYTTLNVADVRYEPGTTFSLLGTSGAADARCVVAANSGYNEINGSIIVGGDGNINLNGPAGGELHCNGPIRADSVTGYYGKLILRGAGANVVNAPIQIGGHVSVTDNVTWTFNATGNSWTNTDVAGGVMRMGAEGVLPSNISLNLNGGRLDLNGFNQQVAVLGGSSASSVIANDSFGADAVLTLNTTADCTLPGTLRDGARRLGLTLKGGGSLTLNNNSTYAGDTTILAGRLVLTGSGAIGNSSRILVAAGAVLAVTNRGDATLTLGAAQTLQGNGLVAGNLSVAGTVSPGGSVGSLTVDGNVAFGAGGRVVMEVDNAAGLNDRLNATGTITYGGMLVVTNISATPYANNQVIKLFDGAYTGAFAGIVFPGVTVYDDSKLTVDGTIRVVTSEALEPPSMSVSLAGGTLELAWPTEHSSWRLTAQTNAPGMGLSAEWFDVPGAAGTNRVFLPVDPAAGSVFYRLIQP